MLLVHSVGAVWVGIPLAFHLLFPFPEQRQARPPPNLTPIEFMLGFFFCAGLAFAVAGVFCGAIALGGWLGGTASIRDGAVLFNGQVEAELSELKWVIEPRAGMTWIHRVYLAPGCAALLYVWPRGSGNRWLFRGSVGAEDAKRWRAFLQLAGANLDPPPPPHTDRDALSETALVFLAFPFLYVVGMTLARTLPDLFALLPMNEQMAKLAAFSLFIPGVPLTFLYFMYGFGIAWDNPSVRVDAIRAIRWAKWVGLGLGVLPALIFGAAGIGFEYILATSLIWSAMGLVFGLLLQRKAFRAWRRRQRGCKEM